MDVKRSPRTVFSVLISILLINYASSQFEIGGNITEDVTLDISGSPYNVTSTLVIYPNVTLLIDPGVELHFQPNVGAVFRGSLIANGTETERIKFTGHAVNRSIPIGYHQIRLADGPTHNEGRLEVFFNGQWGTVCWDYWGSSDSMVACRQLGYLSGSKTYNYRYGTGPIWLDDVECSGDELVLWNCNHNGIGVHNCGNNRAVGLVCDTLAVTNPYNNAWLGLQWIQDVNTTFLESVIRYTDIEYAGFFFDNETLQYKSLPAISASGIPPFLDNVNVENNVGVGVKFLDVPVVTAIWDSRIASNRETGLYVTTVGIGKIYVDGTEISDNGGFGIDYGGNTYPEDSEHYKFCGFNMSIDQHIYLDHATNDFVDPYECVEVFQSPPGTTLTAYLVYGKISSGDYYSQSGLEFWNGNTTDNLLASIQLNEVNGELITTTTNSLRVRIHRKDIRSYSTFFTLLITVQNGSDYDLHLQNVNIIENDGGVNVQHLRRRLIVENSNISHNHGHHGINIEKTYGHLLLQNTDISHNKGAGLQVTEGYGKMYFDMCNFRNNTENGIYTQFRTLQSLHVFLLSITSTSLTDNGNIAVNVEQRNCGNRYWRWKFEMVSSTVNNNIHGGLKLSGSCSNRGYNLGNVLISHNTFAENENLALSVNSVSLWTIEHNFFENNIGTQVLLIKFPASIPLAELLILKNNSFITNSADSIVFFDGRSSNGMDEVFFQDNVLANNTCEVVLRTEFNPSDVSAVVDLFNISQNTFVHNIPYPFFHREVQFIPVAVVFFSKPRVSFTANIINNPLFPLQLIITGDNFGTHVKADHNWWGTSDEIQIQEYIWDSQDRYEFATIDYFPFLLSDNLTDVISPNATRYAVPFIRDDVIGGIVHGNVSLSNATYYVDRDITIPQSSALRISSGVVLSFSPFTAIFVRGKVIADGNNNHKIYFEPHYVTSDNSSNSTTIRLVDGSTAWEGRLELFVEGEWHSVCSNYWTQQNARVACRQLGYFDVLNSNGPRQPGTGPILNYPVECKGNEIELLGCKPKEDATTECTSHSYDINIQCRRPQWAGLFFPANTEVSVLRHVTIQYASYRYRRDTNSILSTEAMTIHLNHHELNNLDIVSSNKGIKMLFVDPFHAKRPLSNISISDCTGYALECYSNGVHLNNWNIHNCYETRVTPITNMYTELLKWVDPSDKISTCHLNKTLDLGDSWILSPPLSGSRSCDGIFTISNIDSNGRVSVFVLYSSTYAIITVEEQGKTILTVEGSTPHDNSVVSEGSTITIRHQTSYSRYDYLFYLIVNGVEENNEVPTRQQLDTFEITNINITHILRRGYCMYFNPNSWTELIASDVTMKCASGTYGIYSSRAFEKLYLHKADIKDVSNYGLKVSTTHGVISQSSFYGMNYGIHSTGTINLSSNRTMTVEDTSFNSITSHALYIDNSYRPSAAYLDAHWLIQNCTFDNMPYGIRIRLSSTINSDMVVPRLTIESCNYFATSQEVINVYPGSIISSLISNSIFRENHGIVLNIARADVYSSLSVINNTFEANKAKVLLISNEIPRCHIKDNVFLNNSAQYIVEYVEAVPLSSAMTSNFDHIFHGNSLIGNYPAGTSGQQGLTCTVITRHLSGTFQYNVFENEGFLFEFCVGRFTFFNISDSLDVTFNNWNAGNDSLIAEKIFDMNDWNDRPSVTFSPFLSSEDNIFRTSSQGGLGEISTLGGKLQQDETLTVSDSPYFVRSDITIPDNLTLTIEQGVELLFAPNIGMLVGGSLIARGSYNDRIVMTVSNLNYTDLSWGAVRLQDGPSLWHGRLEIYLNGEWGTVCHDSWDLNDARVVCRQLGFGSPVSYLIRDYTGTPPDRIWLDDVRCTGSETMLSACPSRDIGEHNCGHHEDVGLECDHGLWGGIRIIGNQGNEPESILEYVDIVNTGYLHNEPYPALYIRHASPQIHDVNIVNSSYDGILADTPVTDFKLQNVTVTNTKSGIVLLKAGNVMLDLNNVTTIENKETGLKVHEEDDNSAFSLSYFKTIPICGPETESFITVDKSADLNLHIPPKQNYGSSTSTCDVLVQSIRNETLVLQVYMPRKYTYNYIYIYDHATSTSLGRVYSYYNEEHLTVVSPPETKTLRINSYHYQSYGQKAYIRITTSDENRLIKHTIRDSIVAENKNGGITYNIVPNSLINGVSTMLPYSCHIHIERCQLLSNKASVSDHVIAVRFNGGSRFDMENCLFSGNNKLGGIELYLDDDSYNNKTMHRILNNEFKYNAQGEGMIFVQGTGSNLGDLIQIYGNLLLHNTPIDTESMIEINGVYLNLDSNTVYNNTGKRSLLFKQETIPPEPQECTNNLISYNLGQFSTEKYTIEVGASGIQFHNNVLQNPANYFEMSAMPGSGVINATHNWWGTTSTEDIGDSLRDSDFVIGYPDIIFQPYLSSSPSHVQSVYCPVGYFAYGSDCFGYKGGAVNFDEAVQSCKIDGAILPTRPSPILQGILKNRTQYSTSPSGIWLYYLPDSKSVDQALFQKDVKSLQRRCFIMEVSESSNDNGVRETSCSIMQPYVCTRSARVKCPNNCHGKGVCHGTTCVCNRGWKGEDCSEFHCQDVNECYGFGTCVGPNQCQCRAGWQGRACSVSFCSRYDRCKACAREEGCGWCDTKRSCLPGTPYTPDKEDCVDWFYYTCFTTGQCSQSIEILNCEFRQCNMTASDSDNESCEQCLDVQRCFTNDTKPCQTWNEDLCPSGIVSKNYNDTSRILKAEVNEDVTLLDKINSTIYKCPVVGYGQLEDHVLFVTSQIMDIKVGQILSSDQADGILHRVGMVTDKDRHTLFMGKQADLVEVLKYADFSQPVELEPAGDPAITDDTPNNELLEELLYGNFTTNGSDIIELPEDITPFKCLGHLYVNKDNENEQSVSSFIFLPITNETRNYADGDILISNRTSLNVESVMEIVSEQDAVFVHTELADCSDAATYINGIKEVLSKRNITGDEIDLSCPGGIGRNNLLLLNEDIGEGDLVISQNDTIIGGPGDRFVGQIVSKTITEEYVILEVLTATNLPELQALPHFSLLPTRHRVRRGTFTYSPSFSFSLNYEEEGAGGLKCKGKSEVKFTPSIKFTLEKRGYTDIEALGIELAGTLEAVTEGQCEFAGGYEDKFYIPIGQKFMGVRVIRLPWVWILVSLHRSASLELTAGAQLKAVMTVTSKVTCDAKGGTLWRETDGVTFPGSKSPSCTSENKTSITRGEPPSSGNPDTGLIRVFATSILKAGFTVVSPPRPFLPECGNLIVLSDWLKRATNIGIDEICTKPPNITGLSFTLDVTAKTDIGATFCAHNCPDPEETTLLSTTVGLDKLALTGAFRILDLTAQAQYVVPLSEFAAYRNAVCLDSIYPCCECVDEESGETVAGKLHPEKLECMCPCYCDDAKTVKSVKEKDKECQCDECQDGKTLKRKYLTPECYCNCADGTEREMKLDGSCPCDCTCEDGSYGTIDESGKCPCFCECKDCTTSTLGQSGCICNDKCPPCEANERQVWENCKCQCKGDDECGIKPTCVLGRKGAMCDAPDCFPCQGCNGNGVCSVNSGQCLSTCRCTPRWQGACCDIRRPAGGFGDPHLETLDGKWYDYFGIGEFVFCHSRDNGFGIHSRFFYYNSASLIGAVAVKAGDSVATITTPGTTLNDMPFLRIDGDQEEVNETMKYILGNSTVILDIQQPVANDTSDGVALVILSFQFKDGTSFTIEVRHSSVMHRQYMNIMFTPSAAFLGKTEGLCGFMDNDDTNDYQGPDDVTYDDPIDFADSWRISTSQLNPGLEGSWSWNQSNFHVNDTMDKSYTDPQYVPIYSIDHLPEEQRKVAEEICTALGVEGPLLEGCIYDVAITNDTSFSEQESLKTGCPSQCSGKGRCVNSTCECLEDWSGEDCRIGDCGECVNGQCDAGFCSCDIGWEGTICDVEATCLSVNNCTDPSHGQCLRTDTCLCTPGYTGNNCSLKATCYNNLNCSDHGVCIDFDVCDCDYGWKGNACDMPSCETLSYCSGNGDCLDHDECNCFNGWTGPSCGIPDCTAVADCSRNGDCIAPDTCECYNGYVGGNCNVPLNCSHLNECNGNGVCVFEESAEDLICRCYIGYDGTDCSSLDCAEVNDCSGNGTCVEPNSCECELGYAGSECSVYSCETRAFCSGHGSCVEYDVCNCTEGWLGISCDIPTCHGVNNCSNQGVCIARDLCECYNGYDGIDCNTTSLPNLASPVFLQSDYNTTIPEHTPSGSFILTVQANDTDTGRNGKIIYSFAFGTEFFAISGDTGEITTRIEFDYESSLLPNQFDLIAIAEDGGRPVFSSTAAVSVFISDLNDNCPELYDGKPITDVVLPLDAPIGTIVHQIFAEDSDSGLNGELLYSFFQVPETITKLFKVSDSGTISTLALVPAGMYDLRVSISDQGIPYCSLPIQVNVNVIAVTTQTPTTAGDTTSFGETTHVPTTVSDELPSTSPIATNPFITTAGETTQAQTTMSDEPPSTTHIKTPDPIITTAGKTTHVQTTMSDKPPSTSPIETPDPILTTIAQVRTTERNSSTKSLTEPKATTKSPTQSGTVSPKPSEGQVCSANDDCNGRGICTATGKCQCNLCIYSGTLCEIDAQCYGCSMTVDSLLGEPAEFTEELNDPQSDEYKKTTEVLYPFIETVIYDTETAADAFLFTEITKFTSGSIIVDYTVTLKEGAIVSDKFLDEMNDALLRHYDNPNVTVMNGSLSVSVVTIPTNPMNMLIFTYVGCGVTILAALIVMLYLLNKHLLRSRGNKFLLSFCLSLIGLNASYIALIAFTDSGQIDELICIIVAGFVHYFVIATVAWTVMESITLCFDIKNKFGDSSHYIAAVSVFAWGIPAAIVVITSLVTRQDYIMEDICFLKETPMLASVIIPLGVAVTLDAIVYIYASTIFYQRKPYQDKIPTYQNSKTRLGNDVIVLLLLIINLIFGYLAVIPSTSYFAQPFFCFLNAIFGFVLLFLYVIRKPFTYPSESTDNLHSSKSMSVPKNEKKIDEYANEQPVFHISKTRDSQRREKEYVDDEHPPRHVEEWYKHSKKLAGFQIPRARASSFNTSSSSDRSSSAISNGRRTAYFNPDSVPMSEIERHRFANHEYGRDDYKNEYDYENDGFEEDYF